MNRRKIAKKFVISFVICVVFLFAWALNAQALPFNAAVNYAVGTHPYSVAVGDFNKDGNLDLVTANDGTNSVSILTGAGDGTFNVAVDYAAGHSPISVAVGDFNEDGNPDLAVANWGSENVSILMGAGDGTFNAAVNYGDGQVNDVVVGDFNKDGHLDLATTNVSNQSVSVLMGSGDGTFNAQVDYVLFYAPGGLQPKSVAVGDFNKDGNPDLVVAIYTHHCFCILWGAGDGTFSVSDLYGAASYPCSVAVGDFNTDGNPDLAVANYSGTVSVCLGAGDGTFYSGADYAAGYNPISVAVGDFNTDGNPDLAVANWGSNNVSILTGVGDGMFNAAVDYAAGDSPSSVAVGDFNADGNPDLAVANWGSDNVSVLLVEAQEAVAGSVVFDLVGECGNSLTISFQSDLSPAPQLTHLKVDLTGTNAELDTFVCLCPDPPHPGIYVTNMTKVTAQIMEFDFSGFGPATLVLHMNMDQANWHSGTPISTDYVGGTVELTFTGLRGCVNPLTGTFADKGSFQSEATFTCRTYNLPTVNSVSPIRADAGQTLDVAITGTSLYTPRFPVDFGRGISVSLPWQPYHLSSFYASITIDNDATSGPRDVSVTTPYGQVTLPGGFWVGKVTTQTDLSATSITLGQSLTAKATIVVPGGHPYFPALSGNVTFYMKSASYDWVKLNTKLVSGGAPVTVSLPIIPGQAGQHYLKAIYNGDNNYGNSTSSDVGFTVWQVIPTVTTVLSDLSITLGGNITDNITVVGLKDFITDVTPVGWVEVHVNDNVTAAATLRLVNGTAQFTYTPAAAGDYHFDVKYLGSINYYPAWSSPEAFNVAKANSVVKTRLTVANITLGQAVQDKVMIRTTTTGPLPSATGTWTVEASKDAAFQGAVSLVDTGNVAGLFTTLTKEWAPPFAGRWYFRATYSGDANYASSMSDPNSDPLRVDKAATAIEAKVAPVKGSGGYLQIKWVLMTKAKGELPPVTGAWRVLASQDSKFIKGTTYMLGSGTGVALRVLQLTPSLPGWKPPTKGPPTKGTWYFRVIFDGDTNYVKSSVQINGG